MPEQKYPPEFEIQVRKSLNVPEPETKKLDSLRAQFIARGKAALKAGLQPDSAPNPFRPEKEPNMIEINTPERKTFMTTVRARPALVILIALLLLLALSGVAYAIGRSLGYIPGVGVVEQTPSILILDKPVTVERDGVTLTVEQVFATSEKTTVIYRHVEQPIDTITINPENYQEDKPALILPDGNKLDVIVGRRQPSDGNGILYALDFPPLPEGVSDITLELTRLAGLMPGQGPENWQIPLHLIKGDPSQIVYPVVEYEASPTVASPNAHTYGISISIDKAVDLPDGYILMGNMQWTDASLQQNYITTDILSITDANGQPVNYEYAQPDSYPQPAELRQNWAYAIKTKNFAAPLKLAFYVQTRETANATFQFDPGLNPQNGQTWDLNINVPVNSHVVQIDSVEAGIYPSNWNLEFTMTSDANVVGAEIVDPKNPPMGGSGGGGVPQINTPFIRSVGGNGTFPFNPLSFAITGLDVIVPGDWTITWTPPVISSPPTDTPQVHAEACLTQSSWHQALKSKPSLPADLTGRLALADGYGNIIVANLQEGTQNVIGQGDAPSFSPDGSKVVVVGPPINAGPPDGLYIIDLASGASTYLLGTTPTDGYPLWSPDGTKIAFTRRPEGSMDADDPTAIMVINPDGSNLNQLTPFDGMRTVTAWMPDSVNLVYIARYGLRSGSATLLNIETGGVSEMFRINYGYGSVDISPNGNQAVYENWLPGDVYSIFASSIDGTDQSLLAQGPETTVVIPKWSPDGQWVITTIYEGNSDGMLTLIQVNTCQIIPLPNLNGNVGSWLP